MLLPELPQITICIWEHEKIAAALAGATLDFHGQKKLDKVRILALVESREDVHFIFEGLSIGGCESFNCEGWIVFIALFWIRLNNRAQLKEKEVHTL